MPLSIPLLLLIVPTGLPAATDPIDDLRMNEIQVIGTHNSYHLAPDSKMMELVAANGPKQVEALDYSHRPLAEQFGALGIRQIELDVFADPEGGLFSAPVARSSLLPQGDEPGPDPNEGGVLDEPGPKVLHIPDIDFGTTVPTLEIALRRVRDWSLANPDHVPILILFELKDGGIPGLTTPRPIDAEAIDDVEAVIRATFEPDHLLTPDDVRGPFDSLPDALRARGWPKVGEVRGRVLCALDNGGTVRDLYLDGHENLAGRAMFADAGSTDHPAASWFKRNDPIEEFDAIRDLVRAGFLVRTRADANTEQARSGDSTMRDRALDSGAQFISTDYPEPDPRFTPYRVSFPDHAEARPNPVLQQEAVGRDPKSEATDVKQQPG